MINFTFKGHKISIRNDDWRKLKERFNPEGIEDIGGSFWILKSCPLCEKYRRIVTHCPKCPLVKIGCIGIINSLFRKTRIYFGIEVISWSREYNSQARRQLKTILRRMEKIEASQKEA